jgi:hypothetical protein
MWEKFESNLPVCSSSSHYYKPRINTLEHRKFQKGKSVLIYAFIPDFRLPLFQWVYMCLRTNNTIPRHSAPLSDNARRVHALLSLVCAALCCSVRAGARTVPAGLLFSPVGISVHGSKGNALIAQCIQLSLFFLYLLFARQQYGARAPARTA